MQDNKQRAMRNEVSNITCPTSIKIGQVDFINCFPINIPFQTYANEKNLQIENTIPSKLNEMILNGEVDIAPISSYAYLQNKDKLTPLGDLCIASNGPADSVLLFSNKPIEKLNNGKIALSHASATSNKLVQILFEKFLRYKCDCWIENKSLEELKNKYDAVLLIGDTALIEYSKSEDKEYIYDLGKLWKNYTGLPMVFALWVIRNKKLKENESEAQEISKLLNISLKKGLGSDFKKVIELSNQKLYMPENFYEKYFEHLSYEFNDKCKKGLNIFEEYTCFT